MSAIIDYRGKSPRKTTYGIPLVTAKIVKNGRISRPEEFIDPADYEAWMRRGLPNDGDVVMTTEAPLGEIAQLGPDKVALARRLITLRGETKKLDNTYLKFVMQSAYVQEQLRSRATGTTVLGIRQSELRKVLLPLPPLPEQKAIARVLGALDDKIELNRKMNRTLEAMARAIFKSWFVDFDPVRAKAEGRQPAGMDDATAALFPDAFEGSELGEIPAGWEVVTLGNVATDKRNGVKPADIPVETPYIGLEHMPQRCIALSDWGSAGSITSGKSAFKRGDFLFGKLRPYFHKVGVAPSDGVCSTDIVVVVPKADTWYSYTLFNLSSDDFVAYTDRSSTGTKMPRTKWKDMGQYEIVRSSERAAAAFDRVVRPMLGRIETNIYESRTLTALRDTLLPKLMSGEVRVNET